MRKAKPCILPSLPSVPVSCLPNFWHCKQAVVSFLRGCLFMISFLLGYNTQHETRNTPNSTSKSRLGQPFNTTARQPASQPSMLHAESTAKVHLSTRFNSGLRLPLKVLASYIYIINSPLIETR